MTERIRTLSDWRDAASYRPLLALPRPAFAWEFLRRNPLYRREAPPGSSRQAPGFRSVDVSDDEASFFARWGLSFR